MQAEVYAEQFLSPGSDIAECKEAVEAIKAFVNDMAELVSKRWFISWAVTTGINPVETLPVHTMHIVGNVYKNEMSFENCRHILV